MTSRRARPAAAIVSAALCLAGLAVPVQSASAVAPSALTWTEPASRDYGNGAHALEALVSPQSAVQMPDGDTVFFDSTTRTLRRLDVATGVVDRITGAGSASCTPALLGQEAASSPSPIAGGLGADAAGHLYVLPVSGFCNDDPVLRLADDGTWEAVATNPQGQATWTAGYGRFSSLAVASDGTVYVTDPTTYTVRRWTPGTPSSSPGTIVMGTPGTSGLTGDGGQGTSATMGDAWLLLRGSSLYLADGWRPYGGKTVVRRLNLTTGIVTRVAGTGSAYTGDAAGVHPAVGQAATASAISIDALGATADGSTLLLGLMRSEAGVTAHDIVRFAVGGAFADVRHTPEIDGACGNSVWLLALESPARVLTCPWHSLRTWRLDGSQSGGVGTAYLGLDEQDGAVSPDGVRLDALYPGVVDEIAASPTGAVALAAAGGARLVASLDAAATTKRLGSRTSHAVAFDPGGALLWSEGETEVTVSRRSADGLSTTLIAGGGASALAEGAPATSVSLPWVGSIAVDPASGDVLLAVDSGDADWQASDRRFVQIWSVDAADGTLHLVAGSGGWAGLRLGTAAAAVPLGRTEHIAVEPSTGDLWFANDQQVGRIHNGTLTAIHELPYAAALAFLPNGSLLTGTGILAADGTWSAPALPSVTTVAPMADGTLVASDQSGRIRRSTPVTVPTGAAKAAIALTPGESSLDVKVTPPAIAGLRLAVELRDVEDPSHPVSLAWSLTDGTTTPLALRLTRFGAPGQDNKPALRSDRTYSVLVRLGPDDGSVSTTRSVYGSPLENVVPPPAAASLGIDGTGQGFPRIVVAPPAVVDLDHVAVCLTPAGTTSPDPDHCGTWRATTLNVSYPLPSTMTVPYDHEAPIAYDPGIDNTYTVWFVDLAGNVSPPADVTVPAAVQSTTSPGPVPGVIWRSEVVDGKTYVTFGFRAAPATAAFAAGSQPPPRPLPYGGVWSANTWGPGVPLTAGATYTVALYRWNANYTRWTPTTVTFVAGTSASLRASVTAPRSIAAGGKVTVTGKVVRVVGAATTGTPQASIPVELWSRTSSSAWVKLATGRTGAAGTVSFTRAAPTSSTSYKVVVPEQGPLFPDVATSGTVTVALVPVVSASLRATAAVSTTTVTRGTTVTITTRMNPKRSATLFVQRKVSGVWRTIATRTSTSTGVLSWSWKPTTAGTTYWRVVSAATSRQTSGTSGVLTIKAT